MFSCFVPKHMHTAVVQVGGEPVQYLEPEHPKARAETRPITERSFGKVTVPRELLGKPLIEIAHGRSGDKGDTSNVGIVARKPEYWALLQHLLRPENVKNYLAHLVKGEIHTFELPQVQAFNLVMKEALDGGGMTSMRNDPLGKGMAQVLLNMKITE